LHAAGYRLGVVNAGISGNTAGPDSSNTVTGEQDGVGRFARDVLGQTNVKSVILYLGANDLRSKACNDARTVEGYTTQMISQAASAGVRVVVATIAPSTFCTNQTQAHYGPSPGKSEPYAGGSKPGPQNPEEAERAAYNTWVRTVAGKMPGVVGIADFDKALADPDHPEFLLPRLNSGDNVHPNGTGYKAQAGAVPLNALLP
jgi:lysophospholipase L1-like esterase